MKASFKANFNVADIKKMYENAIAKFDQEVIERLAFVGEEFVANARLSGRYTDQTGNLRSSIRYFIFKDGKLISHPANLTLKIAYTKSGKPRVHQPLNLEKSVLAEIKSNYPKGYVLLGVAGMEYAAYVESKGWDVITPAAFEAEDNLRKSLDELSKKLGFL